MDADNWVHKKGYMHPATYPSYQVEFSRIEEDGIDDWVNHLTGKIWFNAASERSFRETYETYLTKKEQAK